MHSAKGKGHRYARQWKQSGRGLTQRFRRHHSRKVYHSANSQRLGEMLYSATICWLQMRSTHGQASKTLRMIRTTPSTWIIHLMGHEVFIFGCKIMIILMELLRKHVDPSKERGPSSRGNQPTLLEGEITIGRLNIGFVDFLCPRTVGLYDTRSDHLYEGHKVKVQFINDDYHNLDLDSTIFANNSGPESPWPLTVKPDRRFYGVTKTKRRSLLDQRTWEGGGTSQEERTQAPRVTGRRSAN
ncbi:hypothetical protein CSPX01_08122 [Colletotrichum filicis]|nr:hypothetical protein CSPX01_08122 [Colletotrichum filicis]